MMWTFSYYALSSNYSLVFFESCLENCPQYDLLFIRRTSRSLMFLMISFFILFGNTSLIFLSFLYPILAIFLLDLYFLLTLLSIPLGFLQFGLSLWGNYSYSNLVNLLDLLTILFFLFIGTIAIGYFNFNYCFRIGCRSYIDLVLVNFYFGEFVSVASRRWLFKDSCID